jgi:cytosine/adenosine deaminase-related metal-dependent hydrolase
MVRDAGAKVVWSPQSNLRLYGETTDAATALTLGVAMALGADWLPSGSQSLLGELKVARRVLAGRGQPLSSRRLVDMVTAEAARVAGLDDVLGTLAAGRAADLVVFERRRADPWDNVVDADPAWVEAVMIGGDLAYGRSDWMVRVLGPEAAEVEAVVAWGTPMLLDTRYAGAPTGTPAPKLAALRAELVAHYPQVGPIFA